MDRRSFLKAASAFAGAALVPSISLLPRDRTPTIDLADFCAEDAFTRYDLTKPFHQSGMTFATDARICVRTVLLLPESNDPEARLPRMGQLPWDFDERWYPWPKKSLVVAPFDSAFPQYCPVCHGRKRLGRDVRLCAHCEGDGYFYWADGGAGGGPCGHCATVGYTGGVRCDHCNGTGDTSGPSLQKIGHSLIRPFYDEKIRRLDCVEWQPHEAARYDVIRFRFAGGEGLLMPIGDRGA